MAHFKKQRARRMFEVLTTLRPYEQGNHRIELQGNTFIFYYRGTPIMAYDMASGKRDKLHAGEYETTASTRAQRKAIHDAIDEFESVLNEEAIKADISEKQMFLRA